GRGHGKEARIDWSKCDEVGNRREELQVLDLRLDPIDSRAQEIPTKLEIVVTQKFAGVGCERGVFLVQRCARYRIPECERTEISKETAGIVRAKHIEAGAHSGLGMSRAGLGGVASITTTQRQHPGIALVPE